MVTKKSLSWILVLLIGILLVGVIIILPTLASSGNDYEQAETHDSIEALERPDVVAQEFYTWYLQAFGDIASGTFGSPLSDKAYHESQHLTTSFMEHVDEILEGFKNKSSYDPFLCAQNIPQEVTPVGTFLHGDQASVVMGTTFPGHFITLDLQMMRDEWKISNITCAFTPEGTAKAFYTWYLAYIGDPASDEFRNPMVDKAYRDSGFLSGEFIQELDKYIADGIPADPVLMAQDIPHDFSVDPWVEEGTAIVHLQFGTETVRHLKVSMIQELGIWKIDSISTFQ
jgi:hypothetical protein